MEQVDVVNCQGEKIDSFQLNSNIWKTPLSPWNISLANRCYLANRRQGTKKTKSRGEVKASTRKIYRQKGTGRARHGAPTAPQFRGGGVAFGPRGTENYSLGINKKLKKKVLQSLLGEKMQQQKIIIVDQITLDDYKTKAAEKLLTNLPKDLLKTEIQTLKSIPDRTPEQEKELAQKEQELVKLEKIIKPRTKTLIVLAYQEEKKPELVRSFRNLPYISLAESKFLNMTQVLPFNSLIFTHSALVEVEKRLS